MAKDQNPDDSGDFQELVRAVRDLALRVQQLEKRVDAELADASAEAYPHRPSRLAPAQPRNSPLESRIGSQWLNRIGVVAVLFGVAYLLRYVFASEWISAAAWIWIGVCSGIVVIAGSEWFRRRGYRVLSLSLKATGIGVSYLSLWAGLELYKLLSGPQTFSGLVIFTILSAALALRESAEVLAALALIGGFLTPLLISVPAHEGPLFFYIAMLDCATAVVALKRDWSKMLLLSFLGTILLCTTWYFKHYSQAELLGATAAATLFFVIFCISAAWVRRRFSDRRAPRLLMFMEVMAPALYFAALYLLLHNVHHNALALPALGLSALYFAFVGKAERSLGFGANRIVAVYGGLGIAFVAVTLAILLEADWLSLGWFVEAAIAMAIGFWRDVPWLRWGALLLLCAAVVKAFAYDVWQLGLGYRTLSFIGLGVLLLVISFAYQRHGFSIIAKTGKDSTGRLR